MILVSYDMPYQNKFFPENEVTATKMSVSKAEENGFRYAVRSESGKTPTRFLQKNAPTCLLNDYLLFIRVCSVSVNGRHTDRAGDLRDFFRCLYNSGGVSQEMGR